MFSLSLCTSSADLLAEFVLKRDSALGLCVGAVGWALLLWRVPASRNRPFHYECLYAVGGGIAGSTGGFPQSRIKDKPECREAFEVYFAEDGQYWRDLEEAGAAAMAFYEERYFGSSNQKQLLVFDIDETSLSNVKYNIDTSFGATQTDANWNAWLESGEAPPIKPVREVYLAAYAANMSVAFLTGRYESGRAATERNLLKAGFGSPCSDGLRGEQPCYVRLDMRGDEDGNKPASVYKPERRRKLREDGYEVVGSFGDQFSDLEGSEQALASWKLPNPMYFIL